MLARIATCFLSLAGLAVGGSTLEGAHADTLADDSGDLLSLLQVDRGARKNVGRAERAEPVNFWSGKNGDLSRTGSSSFAAPKDVSAGPKWSFDGGLVRAAPLIDSERNVYLSTIPGLVHKFTSEGQLLWNYTASAEIPEVGALANGMLFASSRDGFVFALDMATGAERWRVKVGPCNAGDTWSVTASNDVVVVPVADFVSCDMANTHIAALDARDGSVKWTYRPDVIVYNFLSAIVEGSLVFADWSGRTYRLDVETGKEIWAFRDVRLVPIAYSTGGAVVGPNRIVYVTNNVNEDGRKQGRLSAFDFDTGKRLWFQGTDFEANNAPAVGVLHPSGKGPLSVVVGVGENPAMPPQQPGSKMGRVLAFDAVTGKKLEWEYAPPTWPYEAAAGDTPDHVCLPDSFSNPAIGGDGTVYIGFEDGHLYAVNDANGDGRISDNEVSYYDFQNAFQGSPAIAPGMLVATPCNGMHVYLQ